MSKHWKCSECVKHGTDACYNGGRFDDDNCKYMLIDSDYAYEKGRADYGNEILDYATELKIENGCIDHTENECGEWVTMTIDYSKWAELWWFIEKHKKLEEQSNE